MKKNMINLVAGLVISAVFIYLALRGIQLADLADSFRQANYLYLVPALGLVLLAHYLRCYRWGIVMENLVRYDQKTLFALGSIGFMAMGILPARLGEFARPYLVKQKSGVRMSATMATVIVERVFDVVTLMLIMTVIFLKIPLPPVIFKTGMSTVGVALALLLVLIFLAVKKDFSLGAVDRVAALLPEAIGKRVNHMAHSFIEGLQILPDIKKTLFVFSLSLVLWSVIALSNYVLFFGYGFSLSLVNAFAILVIIAIGVMLPAAPGFVGTYHYAAFSADVSHHFDRFAVSAVSESILAGIYAERRA
jgi:uncharacterized protein (TIRG00374 family)